MTRKIVLADVDNTLYDWPRYFAPSFRAMVHVLARELARPEDHMYDEFKAVFAHHNSLEYAFVIQELESVKGLGAEEIRRLVKAGRGAFLQVQRARLRPYSKVVETLSWLSEQGHIVVGVTNSPLYLAQKRLWQLKLDTLLDGLVAWEGFEPGLDAANDGYVPQSRERKRTRLKRVVGLPGSDCKPSEQHYAVALRTFRCKPSDAWAIGDSLSKDLEPASRLGIKTVWARYGATFDPNDTDTKTLLRVTHWSQSQIDRTYSAKSFEPDWTVDSFEELKRIIPTNLLTLF